MKKHLLATLASLCISFAAFAQGADFTITPRFEGAMGKAGQEAAEWSFGSSALYGFVDGSISDSWSYSASLQFYTYGLEKSFYTFENPFSDGSPINWAYVSYDNDVIGFDLGKVVLNTGLFEFEDRDVDCYSLTSPFWNNTCVYQLGGTFRVTPWEGQTFEAQLVSSPQCCNFQDFALAYSLTWRGEIGRFSTIWTVNRQHIRKEGAITQIGLGNRLSFDNFDLTLDMTNGGAPNLKSFDNSQIFTKLKFTGSDLIHAEAMVGLTYQNRPAYGATVEVFPLKDDTLRFFASASNFHFTEGTALRLNFGVLYNLNFHAGR